MIDLGTLVGHALWIGGLALGLAALSLARFLAAERERRLEQQLAAPGFRQALYAAAILVCLGLLLAASAWWLRGLAGLLAIALAALTAAPYWRQRRPAPSAAGRAAVEGGAFRPARWRRLGRGLVLAGLVVLGAWAAVTTIPVLRHARSVQAQIRALEALTATEGAPVPVADLEPAAAHLATMHRDLQAIDRLAGPLLPAGRALGWIPVYGGDLAAASDLLRLALLVAGAGDSTAQALLPAVDAYSTGREGGRPVQEAAAAALPSLAAARPDLEEARAAIARAEQGRAGVDTARLSPRAARLVTRLDGYLPLLRAGLDAALLAPALLGQNTPRTYLVVAQNNHELRATGGFISGVGEIHVDQGRIGTLSFSDSYAVDSFQVPHTPAPPDLRAVLWGEMWLFRDANWDADLPNAAWRMLDIYARDRGVPADGVVTLDLDALQLLVDAVGPLQVEDIDEPVTGDNVRAWVERRWTNPDAPTGADWWRHRKDFMGEIAAAVLERLKSGQELDVARLARALKQALDEKHVLVYVAEAGATDLLRRQNWDGALAAGSEGRVAGDSLMVVDSNVGFNKVDPNVARSIHYQVDLGDPAAPLARLTLTYKNQSTSPEAACVQEARYGDSYAEMIAGCYWDYVRVYVPRNSELMAGPDLPLPPGSLLARFGDPTLVPPPAPVLEVTGHRVWTGFFALAPLDTTTLTFDYRLPASVVGHERDGQRRYRLYVSKQPGTGAVPFELQVILPSGAQLVTTMPAGMHTTSPGTSISTTLRTDQSFEVIYMEGSAPP